MKLNPYFLRKIKVKKLKMSSAAFLFGALRVKRSYYCIDHRGLSNINFPRKF